jgi:hypothetical protein
MAGHCLAVSTIIVYLDFVDEKSLVNLDYHYISSQQCWSTIEKASGANITEELVIIYKAVISVTSACSAAVHTPTFIFH